MLSVRLCFVVCLPFSIHVSAYLFIYYLSTYPSPYPPTPLSLYFSAGLCLQETEMDDPHLGKVHDSREVDTSCRYEKNTNTLTDGSTNTLFDDNENVGIIVDHG